MNPLTDSTHSTLEESILHLLQSVRQRYSDQAVQESEKRFKIAIRNIERNASKWASHTLEDGIY